MMRFLRKGERYAFSRPIQECSYLDIKAGGKLLAIVLIFCFQFVCLAQESRESGAMSEEGEIRPLLIGEKVPEDFWTMEHLFYVNGDTIRKTLEEHKGKMLVLGFWATWCSSCLKNSPTIEAAVDEYPENLAYVKINSINTKDNIETIGRLLKGPIGQSYKLNMNNFSSVVEDQFFQNLFPSHGYPLYVLINNGIIQVMTFRNIFDKDFQPPFVRKRS